MAAPRIVIGEPFPEVLGLLERIVGSLGYEPVRARASMRRHPPEADAVVLEHDFVHARELVSALRRRNPGLQVVYLEKPFRIEALRRELAGAVTSRSRPAAVSVSVAPSRRTGARWPAA